VAGLFLNYFNDPTDYRSHLLVAQVTCSVLDYSFVGSKNPGWPHVTLLPERSRRKIRFTNKNCIPVCYQPAGYLAENDIIAIRCCDDKGRAFLGAAQIRERKQDNNNVALYKSAHASSSSGRSQSFFREDSLASAVSEIIVPAFFFFARMKSRISR
jgi:hypothetical protein